MLSEVFPKLAETKFVKLLCAFYRSAAYPAIIAVIMTLSELFSLELPAYYTVAVLGAVCLLFADDCLGLLPILCCVYMMISPENNPEHHAETSKLLQTEFLVQLGAMGAVIFVLIVGRLAVFLLHRKTGKGKPMLLFGYLALGASYLLGGAFSPFYTAGEVLFGLIEIISISATYFFFYYAVDWEKTERWYIPAVFTCIGVGMLFQIADMYSIPGVIIEGGFARGNLYTGWATYNNIGCVAAVCIPAASFFALRSKNGWIATVISCLFMVGVVFTQSRGAILFGGVVFAVTAAVVLIMGSKESRLGNVIVYCVALVALAFCMGSLPFEFLSAHGSSGRFEIYELCMETFRTYPAFGAGFFGTRGKLVTETITVPSFSHNTFIQLLSSGGIFALFMYIYHRYQTARLLFKDFSAEKMCLALCVLSILLTSLVDVHFFAFGPGLFYGVLLVAQERSDLSPKERISRRRRRAERKS